MRYKKSQIRAVYLIFFVISSFFFVYPFAGGDGSISNPYNISTCAHLQNMSSNLNANYQLIGDIDCSGVDFRPIGNCSGFCFIFNVDDNPFNGNFDGRNNTISNLNITNLSSADDGWGLFGFVNYSTIEDVVLNNVVINVPNGNYVGGLVGNNYYGEIEYSFSNGNVFGDSTIGGLIGHSTNGIVNNSFATGNVRGDRDIGGLIGGISGGNILNSYSNGNISGNLRVGGLLGSSAYGGNIKNSFATGNVNGTTNVGGLVGYNWLSVIENSFATGNVNGTTNVGGLVGENDYGTIENSFANGNVSGTTDVGGLIGRIEIGGEIRNSYSTGNVSGTNRIGGIVGLTNYGGDIINSYSSGNVHGDSNVGGILGLMYYGSIENSFAMGNVNGTTNVGGLVGEITFVGNVENSFATGNVNGTTNVGGFVGENDGGTISNSYYYNFSGNPDTAIGLDNDGQSVSAETSISYFYSQSNLPLNSWNTSIWEFSGTGFPTISIQNSESTTLSNSAPSLFPFGGFLISLTLMLLFFMN